MRAAHVPVEVLGLQVEGEDIREQRVECAGDVAAGVSAEIGRRGERRLAALLHSLVHGDLLGGGNSGTNVRI